jgi:septum site-determining protein MinC
VQLWGLGVCQRFVVSNIAQSRTPVRFRGRSYLAFVLAPEPPIADWLAVLEKSVHGSAGFFLGRPAVLDLGAVELSQSAIAHLVTQLEALGIRIMGIEGASAEQLGTGLPPALKGGRAAALEVMDTAAHKTSAAAKEPSSLLLDSPVRSGQSIFFPNGDVTVLGSVASGAEIVAGGSIHVYGALRGRAMAGASGGNRQARIFCSKIEAELLAIDGFYRTIDDLEPNLCGRPVQAWLEGEALMVTALG